MSRGVRCSWNEMQRVGQALTAMERGDGERYAELRCVDPKTVSHWQRTAEVMRILDDANSPYGDFEHFQPSHAREIARHFRKRGKPETWDDSLKEEVLGWVERCEDEGLTVEELRRQLDGDTPIVHGPHADTDQWDGTPYKAIYADPPWRYGNTATRSSAEKHYPTLSVEEVCAIEPFGVPVDELAAEKSHLFLWTTNSHLPESFRVIDAWGFEYKSIFVWCKEQMGIGNYFCVSTEFVLLGVRGGLRFRVRDQRNWIVTQKRGRHSATPQEVRHIIKRCGGARRLELFGRELAPGWDVWGNETLMQRRLAV